MCCVCIKLYVIFVLSQHYPQPTIYYIVNCIIVMIMLDCYDSSQLNIFTMLDIQTTIS